VARSVVASWLLDLTADALSGSTDLSESSGRSPTRSRARWTVLATVDVASSATVLSAALVERFASRGEVDFADHMYAGTGRGLRTDKLRPSNARRRGRATSDFSRQDSPRALAQKDVPDHVLEQ
jgi:hypothetical protein